MLGHEVDLSVSLYILILLNQTFFHYLNTFVKSHLVKELNRVVDFNLQPPAPQLFKYS